MEAVNEGCKYVAQARELILRFIDEKDYNNDFLVKDAKILLDLALEKLAV